MSKLEKFNYFQRTDDPASSIGLKGFEVNAKNQLLFYDLQLMFFNSHLSPATWNEEIQRNVGDLINGLIQKSQDPSLRLNNLYFEVTQKQLQLHILSNKEKGLKENNIVKELEFFGNKIKKLVKLQTLKNFTLEELVQSALKIYQKIQVSNLYSIYRQNDLICKRYVIQLILSNSQQSSQTTYYVYDKESIAIEIIKEYEILLLDSPPKIQGQFYISQIMGICLSEIKDQLLFLKNLKEKVRIKMDNSSFNYNVFNEKLVQLLENRDSFKMEALRWTINQIFQEKNASKNPIYQLKYFFQDINANYIKEYQVQKNFFQFLNNVQQQNLQQNEYQYIRQELFSENQVIQSINQVLHQIIYNKKISNRIQNLLNFQEISQQILSILTMSRIVQLPNLNYLMGGELFDVIECNFLKKILNIHIDRMSQFYNALQKEYNISSKNQLDPNLLKSVQDGTHSVSFVIISLHKSIKFNYGIIKSKDPQMNDQSLQVYPNLIKQFIIETFQQKKNIHLSDYAVEQSKMFQPELQNYRDFLKRFIDEQIQTILSELKDSVIKPQLLAIAQNKEPKVFQDLLNIFIPFVDIEEYVQHSSFLFEAKKIIDEALTFEMKALLKFHGTIISFIHEKIESHKQIFNFQDYQIKEIEQHQNDLCEQFNKKILNGQFDKLDVYQMNSEKKLHELLITQYFTQLIEEALNQIFKANEQNRLQEKEQIKINHNYFFLPFSCIENKIEDLMNNQQQEEMNLYLERLQQFTSQVREQVEKKSKIYQRVINFGFTDKKQEIIENQIAEWMGSSYQQLDIDIIQPEAISKQIVTKIDEYYNWSEQEMIIKIKEKQQTDIYGYLEELFEITKQQCELILIHPIKLNQIEFNVLQDFQTELDQIVLEAENEIYLKNQTFQYFKERILNCVLERYQEQIENHLKQIRFD